MPSRVTLSSPIFGLRREIDRAFEDTFGTGVQGACGGQTPALVPPVDVREDDQALTLELALPGVGPDDVQITAETGVLTVRAERRDERARPERERHHVVERGYGTYLRSIQLPQGIDVERIEADFDHGILRVRVPRAARPQPRRIRVRSGGHAPRETSAGQGGTPAPGRPGTAGAGAGNAMAASGGGTGAGQARRGEPPTGDPGRR